MKPLVDTVQFTNKNSVLTEENWQTFEEAMKAAMGPDASEHKLSCLAIALRKMYMMNNKNFDDILSKVKTAIYSKYPEKVIVDRFILNLRTPKYKSYFKKEIEFDATPIPVVVTFPESESHPESHPEFHPESEHDLSNTSASQMRFYHKVDPSGTVVWTARLGKPTPNNVHERSVKAGKALHSSVQLRTASSVQAMRQIQEAVHAMRSATGHGDIEDVSQEAVNATKNADIGTWFGNMEERHDEREEAKPREFPSEYLESFQNELEEILAFLTKLPKDADHYRAFKNKMRRVHEIRSSSHTWIERMKKDGDVPDLESLYWETNTWKKPTKEEMEEYSKQAVEWEQVFKDLFQKVKEQGQFFVRFSKKNIMFN